MGIASGTKFPYTTWKGKWRNDRRSERNLCNCAKKPEKVIPWTVPEFRPLADNVADHELNISTVLEHRMRQKTPIPSPASSSIIESENPFSRVALAWTLATPPNRELAGRLLIPRVAGWMPTVRKHCRRMEHQQTTEYPDNFSLPPEHRGVYQAPVIIVVVEIVLRFKSILPPEYRRDLH